MISSPATTELFDMLLHVGSLDEVDTFFRSTGSFASFIVAVPEDMTLHIFLPYCQKWVEFNLKWV